MTPTDRPDATACESHCWHLSHTLTVHPPIEVSVCCRCGQRKEVQRAVVGGSWAAVSHGPFAPDLTPYFGGQHDPR